MKRRTIMIDEELEKKIRKIQAKLIISTNKNWSFSTVLTDLAKKGLKN